MKVDNPNAFRFLLQDELYLLPQDKVASPAKPPEGTVAEPVTSAPGVAATADVEAIIETPQAVFNYLGKNNKNFLILVNYTSDEYIADEHLTALENILKRKGLSVDDVAILNINKYAPVNMGALQEFFKPDKLLILGKDAMPADIGAITLNQPVLLPGPAALYSFGFTEMMNSNDMKKAFWDQMKNL